MPHLHIGCLKVARDAHGSSTKDSSSARHETCAICGPAVRALEALVIHDRECSLDYVCLNELRNSASRDMEDDIGFNGHLGALSMAHGTSAFTWHSFHTR